MSKIVVELAELRAVVRFCVLLRKHPQQIFEEMVEAYGDSAPSYSFICKWVRRFEEGRTSIDDDPRSGRPQANVAEIIVAHLEEQPFASVRSTAQELNLAPSTVYRTFTQELGLQKFVSHWVPHTLTEAQRQQRVELSRSLLMRLESSPTSQVITADESWFYYSYNHEGQWALSKNEVAERPKRTIKSPKVMVMVMWGVRGSILVKCVPEGSKFNSTFVLELLEELSKVVLRFRPKLGLRNLILHWDNATPHRSSVTMSRLADFGLSVPSHPPYSPDVAPSDFFLFGYLKDRIRGNSFMTTDELVSRITSLISEIPRLTLEKVFQEWKDRLSKVIQTQGTYITK